MNLENNYLIKRLEEGKKTKVMLMSHNSYWCQFEFLKSHYSNFEICCFGSGTAYADMRKNDIPKDCDFILLDGSNFYIDNEFCETKKMAMKMSEENNKRVSMGYVYFIPIDQRENIDISREIKIVSFKNGNFDERTISIPSYDILTLANIVVKAHADLENQIILQKL